MIKGIYLYIYFYKIYVYKINKYHVNCLLERQIIKLLRKY